MDTWARGTRGHRRRGEEGLGGRGAERGKGGIGSLVDIEHLEDVTLQLVHLRRLFIVMYSDLFIVY